MLNHRDKSAAFNSNKDGLTAGPFEGQTDESNASGGCALATIPLTLGEIEMVNAGDTSMQEFRDLWPEVRTKPGGIEWWLQKQYVGELEAIASMEKLLRSFDANPKGAKLRNLVVRVIRDERNHVAMIERLLQARGVTPEAPASPEVLSGLDQWAEGCAATSRAEAIRAGEIRTVIADLGTPDDIRTVFGRVLKEEVFHEKAFRELAGQEAMANNQSFQGWGTGGGACFTRVCSERHSG